MPNFEKNPHAPNAHLPAEALSIHEINNAYDDMVSAEWRGKQARNYMLEGWRLLELGAHDPGHALDVPTAQNFFLKAMSISELDSQASDQETYRYATLGLIAAPTFANRRPYQMLDADILEKARYQNGMALEQLLASPHDSMHVVAEQIAYDALLPRPIFPASPREHNGGARDFYSLHHTMHGMQSLGIDVKIVGKNVPEQADTLTLRVGSAIMDTQVAYGLARNELDSEKVNAHMLAYAKLLVREIRVERPESRQLIPIVRQMLDRKWRRESERIYPPA